MRPGSERQARQGRLGRGEAEPQAGHDDRDARPVVALIEGAGVNLARLAAVGADAGQRQRPGSDAPGRRFAGRVGLPAGRKIAAQRLAGRGKIVA